MKKRGLASPDLADALALTFAYPVAASDHRWQITGKPRQPPRPREYLTEKEIERLTACRSGSRLVAGLSSLQSFSSSEVEPPIVRS
jgi:hypothetical protein